MPANTQNPKKRKTSWKPGQSGNPKGAPKRGESWAEILTNIGKMTGDEISERAIKLWKKTFQEQPKGVTLKELVGIRVFAALLDDPNARLLKEVMDRTEGKITDRVELAGDIKANIGLNQIDYRTNLTKAEE